MRSRSLLSVLTLAIVATATLGASAQSMDAWVGTWKMKSANTTFSNTTKYEIVNGVLRLTTDSATGQGEKIQVVRYVHFDNKEHTQITSNPTIERGPVSGNPMMFVYTWIDAHTFEWVGRIDGKVVTTTRLVLSQDRKTQTLTTARTNEQGQVVNMVMVFEKQ